MNRQDRLVQPHARVADGLDQSSPRASLRASVVLAVVGILSILLLVAVWRLGDRWTSQDLQRLHVAADIQSHLTSVHLTLKQLEEGRSPADVSQIPEELRLSRVLARALVEGDDTGLTRRPLSPASEPEVAEWMADVRMLVESYNQASRMRLAELQAGDVPPRADPGDAPETGPQRNLELGDPDSTATTAERYEQTFARVEAYFGSLQGRLGQRILANKQASMWAIFSILVGWVVLILGAAYALWLREKQRFRAEQALRDREEQLLQAQKMEAVGRLAGGIAHDINNYLAAIRGQCELVKMKTSEGNPTRRRMDLVLDTSDRASSLIERLLAFSRRQPVERRVVDLNAVVSDLQPMMERLIGADLQLQTLACSEHCTLHIDPSQIEQVIVNLLINAREAMPRGGRVRLSCNCRRYGADDPQRPPGLEPGAYVEMRVEDNGRGIAPEHLDRIFEPFFTTKDEASGLGLPTVYGIVTQNGGTVQVESEAGVGTTFRVLLPRHADSGVIVDAARSEDLEVAAGHGERLLVVDDHAEFRSSLQELLEAWGYEVETAADAAEARSLFARPGRRFDLVITDVVMPGGSGPELLDRLRQRHGPVRALYVSGYTGDEALGHVGNGNGKVNGKVNGGDVGDDVVELLHKPFRFEILAHKVRQALDRSPGGRPGG